jgi:hypothetical protein
MPKDEKSDLVAQLQPIARDAERLTALHAELLRSELRQTTAHDDSGDNPNECPHGNALATPGQPRILGPGMAMRPFSIAR